MVTAPTKPSKRSSKPTAPTAVPIEDWGKEHWSLLAYVETCVVDKKGGYDVPMVGEIDRDRIRCNGNKRPELFGPRVTIASPKWKPDYGTRLKGYFLGGDKRDPSRRLDDHDDWDCLDDFEAAGVAEVISTVNGFVRITDKGLVICKHLREHKAKGGHFATFDFKPEMSLCKES